ncbi:hypothetical protein ELS30_02000 [Salmonella enterica subsp. enterica serovar Java]|nr:hypothetical protein [Salmonella enterica subsp. enterica serovar Java]ECH8274482.1 hypothetical protein [Salmonella enterica subsp. enterica]EBY6347957.1 hypothetical protein [Salmonella enterica subsp. enterica serovar Java]ECA2501011.1 hypothetical protein [Salmonella enterica subsp. enterica serovar Java]ECA5334656.1 hypothetical protein [Salmonella enterica subsp. enterica serovar Java]
MNLIVHFANLNAVQGVQKESITERLRNCYPSVKNLYFFGDLIENPRVLGSIPSPGTTYSENPAYGWVFAFLGMEIRSPHLWPD